MRNAEQLAVSFRVLKRDAKSRFFVESKLNDRCLTPWQVSFLIYRCCTRTMPKGKRKFTRRKRSSSAPAVLRPRKPSKRKCWDEDQMLAAMSAVKGGSHIKRAAEEHGVPVSTLRDRISGRVVHGTKPGPKPYLSTTEEAELSSFLKSCANMGYGRTRTDVMGIARSVAAEKGILKGSKVTQGWWRRFCKRQPDLSLHRGDVTAHARMDAVNSETLKQYFTLLNDVLTEKSLRDKRSSCSTSQEFQSCSEPSRKRHKERHNDGAVTEIDTNVCCVCFGLYSEDVSGVDWIECACGRWLHEECGEECVVDADGKERFCPTCL